MQNPAKTHARVLIIAGSDCGGGAGIQGDIKTVTCLGGYAATAITALTAQNTTGVYGIHDIPTEFIAQQIKLVLEDIGAAEKILALGCNAVLIKGGHLAGETLTDLLATNDDEMVFTQARINTKNTHGTGCALASAIATGLAQKMPLYDAVSNARQFVLKAIETAPSIGKGHGAINHGHIIS